MAIGTLRWIMVLAAAISLAPAARAQPAAQTDPLADLILVEGDPLADIDLIADADRRFLLIMKDGIVVKDLTGR